MIDKKTTNAVRNVLMNELGLSREIIKQEMGKIIVETVEKHFNSSSLKNLIQKRIEQAFASSVFHLDGKEKLNKAIQSEITTIVRDEAKEFFLQRFEVGIRQKGEMKNETD